MIYFSLFVFPIAAIFWFYKKFFMRWKGDTVVTDMGRAYFWHAPQHKGRVQYSYLGIKAPELIAFTMHRERKLDRFFRLIGLSQEYQLGDKELDDLVYIVSDHLESCEKLKYDSKARQALSRLLKDHAKSIFSNGERVWIKLASSQLLPPASETATQIIEDLTALQKAFTNSGTAKAVNPYVVAGCTVMALHFGVAIAGFAGWMATGFGRALVENGMFVDSLRYSLPAIGLWLAAIIFFFRSSSRGHLIILDALLTGTAGCILMAYVGMFHCNQENDTSRPQYYDVTVTEKYIRTGRKRRKTYYVITNHWVPGKGSYTLMKSKYYYNQVNTGSRITITVKDGYLGYPWVESEAPKGY